MSEFDVNRSHHTDQSTTGRWVLSHLSHHKLLIVGVFNGAFGNAALAAVVPVLIGRAFDAALASPADRTYDVTNGRLLVNGIDVSE